MSVPNQIPESNYIGNGTTKTFAANFEYASDSDVFVTINGVAPEIGQATFANGVFTFVTAPASGAAVRVYRSTPIERDTEYDNHDNVFRPRVVNIDFDRIWFVLQEYLLSLGITNARITQEIADRIQADAEMMNYILNEDNELKADYILRDETLRNYIDQTLGALLDLPDFQGIEAQFVKDASGKSQQEINDSRVYTIDSVIELMNIPKPRNGQVVFARHYDLEQGIMTGGGVFVYSNTKQLENDGGNIFNGWVRQGCSETYLNALNFGCVGKGLENDLDHIGFVRISNTIKNSAAKSFVIHLPKGDYVVGKQDFIVGTGFKFKSPLDVSFSQMTDKNIIFKSDNANIRFRNGMHFGLFNKNTKERLDAPMPFYPGSGASWEQYKDVYTRADQGYMFNFENINGLLVTGRLTLNGNSSNAIIGGQYGDVGWQLMSYGFRIVKVKNFDIANITSTDFLLDCFYIAGVYDKDDKSIRGVARNLVGLRGCRQDISICGGQNISLYDCNFSDAGTPELVIKSMPMAACDIEAELSPILNLSFYNCFFGRAGSQSLVADSGNTRAVNFYRCKFINDLGSVCWVRKPEFYFDKCYFNGYIEGQYRTEIESDRTIYDKCTFTDDPEINPNIVIREHLLNFTNSNPKLNDCIFKIYKSGIFYTYQYNGKLPFEFNRATVEVYGGSIGWAVNGIGTMRIRDKRPADQRPTKYLTFSAAWDGVVVVENLDGAGGLIPYNAAYRVQTKVLPDNKAFLPFGDAVSNATGTDDTAQKLNALIASLKKQGAIPS
jgi:hypothetical protein